MYNGIKGIEEFSDYIVINGEVTIQKVDITKGNLQRLISNSVPVSWKALSHALRVVLEVKELLTNSFITFPLKDAQYLLEIKQGDWDIKSIIDHLEKEIANIDTLLETTSLSKKADQKLVDQYLLSLYKETI